jgi:hypothetical protein
MTFSCKEDLALAMSNFTFCQKGSSNVSRSIQALAFFTILLSLMTIRVRADLIITLSDATVAPGGTGTMDITVTSNHGNTLSAFGLELQITPVGSPSELLQFSMDQTDPYGNSNYVFSGASFNQDNGPISFWSSPFQTVYMSDTIVGSDSSDSTNMTPLGISYVTLSSTPSYLATVQFQAPTGSVPGDQFQITLVNDPGETYFMNRSGYGLRYQARDDGGLITIESAIATPEPPTLPAAALATLIGLLYYGYRQRQRHSRNSLSATSILTP